MSVHYRFKSALEYDTITFDGLHISVKDLKNAIAQQKRIGKSTDFDLQVTNAQTKEVYDDENALIPKNTSLLIARVPVAVPKPKQWEGYGGNDTPPQKLDDGGPIAKAVDLSSLDAPEDDKIKAMMSQSTQEYDPSNYLKIRGANQVGPVPVNYRCYKCHQGGHWIKDCPISQGTETLEIKKSTGIPRSFMVPVEGPQVPGAMITPNGQYAVPVLDHEAYNQKNPVPAPVPEPKPEIPEDLVCSVCSDLLTDAVMIPCCGNSFCDECIRGVLLESEDHECPDCHEKDISPGTLIPNRFLRKSVANFKNTTGYEKKQREKEQKPEPEKKGATPPPQADSTEKELAKSEEEKTVISEADSTEHAKSDGADFAKEADPEPGKSESESLPEGPPGVSPSRGSPKHHISSKITREHRDRDRDHSSRHHRHRGESPRKHRIHRRSPNYDSRRREQRPGTPTRDEPRIEGGYPPSSNTYSESSAPPMMGGMPPVPGHMPPGFPPGQVPPMGGFPQGPPPPNYRMPPPGPGAPPFMPPPGPFPPASRPVFDPSRPPMSGPPPFNPAFSRGHREFGRRGVRDRTPPGIIDDPLAAFNRILREKDERRAKQQRANNGGGGGGFRRSSYSRSRSRSRSYSRSPPPKGRRRGSRSPRRRGSRSRSRSFSISRSRSRSWGRNSSPPPYRQSPPPSNRRQSPPRRAPPPSSRYRSPSPPPRRRGEREFRDNRGDRYKDRRDDRDDKHYYDNYDDRRNRGGQWRQQDNYYDQGYQNRFPSRDYGPPPVLQHPNMPVQPRFDLIGPPGVEQPPIPGLENESPKIDKFDKQPSSPREKSKSEEKEKECRNRSRSRSPDKLRSKEKDSSKSPDKWRNPSPRSNSRSKDRTPPPDKHKRRRRDDSSSDRETRRRDRDHSDDERKKKDKKRHKEKREKDKKKKKEKHRRTEKEKDKRSKEEFKQIIPKVEVPETNKTVDYEELKRIEAEERERLRLEEEKRLVEEKKKEERRLRFLEDEKKRKLEEEKKRKIEEEKRKRLEEMLLKIEEDKPKVTQSTSLYEEEGVMDPNTVENYGKLKDPSPKIDNSAVQPEAEEMEEGEVQDDDNLNEPEEEEEGGVLELLSNDLDLKTENDIFAPVPERSKWEIEGDEGPSIVSPTDKEKVDSKIQKVTNEVLKRAENAIFAKAINAIRPIEVKKASGEKIKIHLGELERKEPRIEVTVPVQIDPKKIDLTVEKPRLSVKDRLGIKIDDADRVVKVDRKPSRSISPFSRRERRLDDAEYRRHDRKRRSRSRRRDMGKRSDRRPDVRKDDRRRSAHRKEERERSKSKHKDEKKDKRRRSPSKSGSEEKKDKKKKKDKKLKKEKEKKTEDDKQEATEERPKSATAKRKPTLDEANFEPDYDLELHDDDISGDEVKQTDTKEESEDSSASDSDSSSSEEERKKKRHKKQKRRKRRDSSSSSYDSSSDSSDSDKEKKRRKHKKSKRKKKKSKHK